MGRAATFLSGVVLAAALGVAACGVEKGTGTIAASGGGSGGAGGFAGAARGEAGAAGGAGGARGGAPGGHAQGGAGGQGGVVAGGASGHDPIGCGGSAPAAVPKDCVPSITFALDGGPQPFPRCEAGAAATAEICDDSSAFYHCPFGYSPLGSCGCFISDIDQDCPDAGTN